MDEKTIQYRAGNAPEVPGDKNRKPNPAGLYRHEESGTEIIAISTPKFGSPQADGFIRMGFKFVRPAKPEEIVRKRIILNDNPVEEPNESVEELEEKLKQAKLAKKKLTTKDS